uniref:ribosomal protein S8 n=1 Tax=Leontynka pallida TaxID=2912034 RepID=UPI002027BF46|nr:ribosomal protein S8 [Leontynka pallida]UPQ43860.1 ribosomal protein S8 [Leontynka pallida]
MVNQSFSKQTLANQSGVVEQHKQKQDNKLVNALGVTNVKEVSFAGLSLEVKRRSIGQNSGLINDSISDMLTRIRNAVLAKKYTVTIPHTKLTQQIAQILEKEGFISGFYMEAPKTRSNVTAAYSNTTSEASKDKPANLTSSNITDLAFAGVITQPLVIRLKYRTKKTYNGKIKESCIINLKRISKPGLRVYANVREIQQKRILGGTGILIISTSAGLMTDIEARSRGIGGELLCAVW